MESESGGRCISAEMRVLDVLTQFPATYRLFARQGIRCPSCAANSYEDIRGVAAMLGADLEELLDALNQAARPGAALPPAVRTRSAACIRPPTSTPTGR